MTGLYLSRVRLKSDSSVRALVPMLLPDGAGDRAAASHHWIWSLFADGPDRRRDFLWREDLASAAGLGGVYYTLSTRLPCDDHGLFRIESQPFDPTLKVGDRLRFSLRASPAVSVRPQVNHGGKPHDPVALALAKLVPEDRIRDRQVVIQTTGQEWLARQGAQAGFALTQDLTVRDGWRVLPRSGSRPIRFGILDLEGHIEMTNPDRFLHALASGFGKARAFGCGLMMIRRAS